MSLLHFIETPIFQRLIDDLLPHDDYAKFQEELRNDPEAGKLIAGTGGCRKIRWSREGMGKSGGVRVIYYYFNEDGEIYLFVVYPKNVKDNLTKGERNALKKVVEALEKAKGA